jgi:hypothetical protein
MVIQSLSQQVQVGVIEEDPHPFLWQVAVPSPLSDLGRQRSCSCWVSWLGCEQGNTIPGQGLTIRMEPISRVTACECYFLKIASCYFQKSSGE